MYLDELPKYRNALMEKLCTSEDVIGLLRPDDLPGATGLGLRYKRIFPYDHILDKTSEAGTYVCFDIDVPRVANRAFADLTIYIWIITHERYMVTPAGLRLDRLSTAIENLINGSSDFGVGRVELKSFTRLNPADKFHGRCLTYKTVDFNRR